MKFDETWEIEKFLWLSESDTILKSQTFCAGGGVWSMKLFPFGYEDDHGQYVSIYLQLHEVTQICKFQKKKTKNQGIDVIPKFFILDDCQNIVWSQRKADYAAKERRFVVSTSEAKLYGYQKFLPRKAFFDQNSKTVADLLPQGNLTIRCQLKFRDGIPDEDSCPVSIQQFSSLLKVEEEAEEDENATKKDKHFFDVTFNVCGKKIKAHKAILSLRSQSFKTCFRGYKSKAIFDVLPELKFDLQMTPEIFSDVLRHAYGGTPGLLKMSYVEIVKKWPHNIERILVLMVVAFNYKMLDLVKACEMKLVRFLRRRSLNSKASGPSRKSNRESDALFFFFDDKPFSIQKMKDIAAHVDATRLLIYLTSCQAQKEKIKREKMDS